jgi:hypothetical protein
LRFERFILDRLPFSVYFQLDPVPVRPLPARLLFAPETFIMKTAPVWFVRVFLLSLFIFPAFAQQQDAPRRSTPRLTTEDVRSGRSGQATAEDRTDPVTSSANGETTRAESFDARALIKNAFSKLTTVNSLRTKIQITGGQTGREETLIETVRPNRLHLQNDLLETIVIGSTVYTKVGKEDWKVVNTPVPKQQFDPQNFMNSLLSSPNLKFIGKNLGKTTVDNVSTIVYEITEDAANSADRETVLIWIGEADQLPRKIKVSKPNSPMQVTFWYSAFNAVSIKAPL